MGTFLSTLRVRFSGSFVESQCFLFHHSAAGVNLRLTFDLMFRSLHERAERVEILDLRSGVELLTSFFPYRNICLEADHALFHVTRIDIQIAQNCMKFGGVSSHFFWR